MRFNLPENLSALENLDEREAEPYFGLPQDLVDNETIPLPPGLSRVRTMRKIHLELDVVRERLKQWDSVQAKMEHTLLAMRQTAHEIGGTQPSSPGHYRLEQDYCGLQSRLNKLKVEAGALDPRTTGEIPTLENFITVPSNALHYLAVYDDNPWKH